MCLTVVVTLLFAVVVDEKISLEPSDLSDIAQSVGDGWRQLARVLEPRPFYKNELIKFEDGPDHSEHRKALRMLEAWKEEHKDKATADCLKQALTEAGFQGVAIKQGKEPISAAPG